MHDELVNFDGHKEYGLMLMKNIFRCSGRGVGTNWYVSTLIEMLVC